MLRYVNREPISEASFNHEFKVIALKRSFERSKPLGRGGMMLSGLGSCVLLQAVEILAQEDAFYPGKEISGGYSINNTSSCVLKLILGTVRSTKRWRNLDEFNRYDW